MSSYSEESCVSTWLARSFGKFTCQNIYSEYFTLVSLVGTLLKQSLDLLYFAQKTLFVQMRILQSLMPTWDRVA